MLGRRTKAAVIVVALLVLAVEGVLLVRYYDRYYASEDASGSAPALGVTMPEGTAYEGTPGGTTATGGAPPAAENDAVVHEATDENSRGDYAYLSHPRVDGDPNAFVFASPTGSYDHNIGVWYEPERRRWAIFNQDMAAVPDGATFEVVVPPADEGFVHRAELDNTVGNATYLDDPLTDGKADAVVSVTQNWNPGGGTGIYNDHPVGVFYDVDVQKWSVYNRDGAPMPEGAAFNVAVSGEAG